MGAEWQTVWAEVDARREELGMSLTELYEKSVSETTFRKMRIEGVPVLRGPKRALICDALKWTRDSIERILAGMPPEPLHNGDADELDPLEFNADNQRLLEALTDLGAEVSAMRAEFDPTAQQVAQAADTLDQLREQARELREQGREMSEALRRLAARVAALEGEGRAPGT